MKVLMLSIDKKVLEQGSRVNEQMTLYGKQVEELHIVLYTLSRWGLSAGVQKISENVYVHPTSIKWRVMYPFVVFWYCLELMRRSTFESGKSLITSQ